MDEIEWLISTKDSSYIYLIDPFLSFLPPDRHTSETYGAEVYKEIDIPFIDENFGLAMIKLPDVETGCTNRMKVKFVRNTQFLDITKN